MSTAQILPLAQPVATVATIISTLQDGVETTGPPTQHRPNRRAEGAASSCDGLGNILPQTDSPPPSSPPLAELTEAARIRAQLGWLPRPPDVACNWCGAGPGEQCLAAGRRLPASTRRLRVSPDGCHPSRRCA